MLERVYLRWWTARIIVEPWVLLIKHGLLARKLLVDARNLLPHSLLLFLSLFKYPLDVFEGLRVRPELHNDLLSIPCSELKGFFLGRGAVLSIAKHEIHAGLM
jgi:hypothetical protein